MSWLLGPVPCKTRQYWDLQDWGHVHTIGNMTSFDIDFHLIYFLNKALLYCIDNATDLSGKMLLLSKDVCDSEGVFPLTNTYATQVI